MTIRFAPARNRSPFAGVVVRGWNEAAVWMPANDNGPMAANDCSLLSEALRHFGTHGLGAAQTAIDNATSARAVGDAAGFAHWLSVCRVLDRRLAESAKAGFRATD